MVIAHSLIVILLCSQPVRPNATISVVVPWLGRVETDGPAIGSSFMIAMERNNYSVDFLLMPFYCDSHFSVISQVSLM